MPLGCYTKVSNTKFSVFLQPANKVCGSSVFHRCLSLHEGGQKNTMSRGASVRGSLSGGSLSRESLSGSLCPVGSLSRVCQGDPPVRQVAFLFRINKQNKNCTNF